MTRRLFPPDRYLPLVFVLVSCWLAQSARAAESGPGSDLALLEQSFQRHVKPFLNRYCQGCHNAENLTSGVRVDQLDASLAERQLRLWEHIEKQVATGAMPPEDELQPSKRDRERVGQWINRALSTARSRPTPKNGITRRLTVAQYRNTLRELLMIDDDLSDLLPPDAVSRDGFLNNEDTQALSPLLLEAYWQVAEQLLDRAIVDSDAKPTIQNFRVDFGRGINNDPCPDELILGAGSALVDNEDFVVNELVPNKPFAFEPFFMRTKYRFIEGYQGNSTVRGWRDFDSIYHAVFACMRGTNGYPKGHAYSTVPGGLLLRPAIPSAELFQVESTMGPRANFKISLRELPDYGRFRVTVTAAKYDDGLLLDRDDISQTPIDSDDTTGLAADRPAIVCVDPESPQTIEVPRAGVYRLDVHEAERPVATVVPDASRLDEELAAHWSFDKQLEVRPHGSDLGGRLVGDAHFSTSPFGQALTIIGNDSKVVVPHNEVMNVGHGDFTVAAWIHPNQLRQGDLLSLSKADRSHGWHFELTRQGALRIATADADNRSAGTVSTPSGSIIAGAWQHVAAVVRRGKGKSQLLINGSPVAKGSIRPADLNDPNVDLVLGNNSEGNGFRGAIDDVRLYTRALDEAEIRALVEPGRDLVSGRLTGEKARDLTLVLGEREFSGTLHQSAFLAVRLGAGTLKVEASYPGTIRLERITFTPLVDDHPIAHKLRALEQRSPRLGVYLGLRRDCGSTLAPVGLPQTVAGTELSRFVFEGAINNFPRPEVEKDNVNYLAGVREIGVRSEYTDGREMPRLLIRSVEFEGPFTETWPPKSHQNIFIDSADRDDPRITAQQVIRSFATRAYRRKITSAEEAALLSAFHSSFDSGIDFRQSIQGALQVVLTSPQFLFLIENSRSPKPEPLDEYELASKLSYFLWNGPPDARLLQHAVDGRLSQELESEVTRMIDDPRFSRFAAEFVSQWLALDKFSVLEPDRERFPKLTRDARVHLRQEPVRYFEYLARHDLPISSMIESDFIVANEVVANYYELGDRTESGFDFVPIKHNRRDLGGVLSQAAIMAGLSDGRESNPVKRGAWLARKIIAEPPDDPPPNVPALKEETQQLSLRERLELHRNQTGCLQCHAKIDPWGIPLEQFDAGGRWKQQAVDARSTLPDSSNVSGVNDLKRYLCQDRIDQVAFSFLKHLATYANGRDLSYHEIEYLKRSGAKLKEDGYRLQDMLRFVVVSPLFLEK